MLMRSANDMSMMKLLKADAGHGDSLNHCAPIYRRVTQCDISSTKEDASDAFIDGLDSLQCLINLLGQISQILCTDRLDDDLFLIAQGERLSKISVCQGRRRFSE